MINKYNSQNNKYNKKILNIKRLLMINLIKYKMKRKNLFNWVNNHFQRNNMKK